MGVIRPLNLAGGYSSKAKGDIRSDVFRDVYRPLYAAVMLIVHFCLRHIPQTGQRTGRQLSASHSGRSLVEKKGSTFFCRWVRRTPLTEHWHSLASPQIIEPAGGHGQ